MNHPRLARRKILFAATLSLCAALLMPLAARAQHMSWQTGRHSQPVVFLYPQQLTVPAGKPTAISLHFRVAQGLHINSHSPSEPSYIRTELIVPHDPKEELSAIDYPPGGQLALPAFPKDKLSVYTGQFAIRAHLTSAPGDHLLRVKLRYQACATNSCDPPRTIPVAVNIIGK